LQDYFRQKYLELVVESWSSSFDAFIDCL